MKDALVLDEEPDLALVRRVVEDGYAPDLNEPELEKLGRDPFLTRISQTHRKAPASGSC